MSANLYTSFTKAQSGNHLYDDELAFLKRAGISCSTLSIYFLKDHYFEGRIKSNSFQFWRLHHESLKGTKSVVLTGSIRGRAPRTGKDDPFSFGWQRNNLAFQAPPSQLFLQIWKGPRRPKWTGLGVTTGHQSPSRKYSLHCKVDTPFTDNLVSDTWFRWLGNNCLDWIWDGRGFIMVSSVRHLEHP